MPYASNRIRLYYEEAGPGAAMVFAREFSGDFRSWETQVRHCSRRGDEGRDTRIVSRYSFAWRAAGSRHTDHALNGAQDALCNVERGAALL
jgi:hypothetical protein